MMQRNLREISELVGDAGHALNIFSLFLYFTSGTTENIFMKYIMTFKCNMSDYFRGADCGSDHFMWFLHMDAVKGFSEGG
jgi:hypothetical protein